MSNITKNDLGAMAFYYATAVETYFTIERALHMCDDENDLRRVVHIAKLTMTEDDWAELEFDAVKEMVLEHFRTIVLDATKTMLSKITIVEHNAELN